MNNKTIINVLFFGLLSACNLMIASEHNQSPINNLKQSKKKEYKAAPWWIIRTVKPSHTEHIYNDKTRETEEREYVPVLTYKPGEEPTPFSRIMPR